MAVLQPLPDTYIDANANVIRMAEKESYASGIRDGSEIGAAAGYRQGLADGSKHRRHSRRIEPDA